MKNYILGEEFEGLDYSKAVFPKGDYEGCHFRNCQFANADLSGYNFEDCSFENCDLSMITCTDTTLGEVIFRNCKMLGVHFELCNPFLLSLYFEECFLNLAGFYNLALIGTTFKQCNLVEVDFTNTNLTQASFEQCDLSGAIFENTTLVEADFRTAKHYIIDPEKNNIKKAKFSLSSIAGLLKKYDLVIDN